MLKNIISPLLHMRTCDILSKCDTMILTPLQYSFVYYTHFLQFVVTFDQVWMEITLMYTKYLHPVENINNNFCQRGAQYLPTNIQFVMSLMSVGHLHYIKGYYTSAKVFICPMILCIFNGKLCS